MGECTLLWLSNGNRSKIIRDVNSLLAYLPANAVGHHNLVFQLLCVLRDTGLQIPFYQRNIDVLYRYFRDKVTSDFYRDCLDAVSALATDEELSMLTHVAILLGSYSIPGRAVG